MKRARSLRSLSFRPSIAISPATTYGARANPSTWSSGWTPASPLTIVRPSMSGIRPTRSPMSPLERYAGMNSGRKSRTGGGLIGSLTHRAGATSVPGLEGADAIHGDAQGVSSDRLTARTGGHAHPDEYPPLGPPVSDAQDEKGILDHGPV